MPDRDCPDDRVDAEQTPIARRGFLKTSGVAITAAIAIPTTSGVAAAHFRGPDKPTLEIDVKPGSDDNTINLNSEGVVPVAVLQTDEFNRRART